MSNINFTYIYIKYVCIYCDNIHCRIFTQLFIVVCRNVKSAEQMKKLSFNIKKDTSNKNVILQVI